jgi:hypothetical protein
MCYGRLDSVLRRSGGISMCIGAAWNKKGLSVSQRAGLLRNLNFAQFAIQEADQLIFKG